MSFRIWIVGAVVEVDDASLVLPLTEFGFELEVVEVDSGIVVEFDEVS